MVLCDVHKGRSGVPCTAKSPASSAKVLEQFTRSPQTSTQQCARETGASRTSIWRILETARWKVFILRLLHALNEDDPDRRVRYCEWFQNMVRGDEEFVGKMVWSDEAQFKLNGTVNRHNCVYWAPENSHVHVEKEVNLLGLNVWCGLSLRGLIGPFFFEGTVTGHVYLDMLRTSILPAIRTLFWEWSTLLPTRWRPTALPPTRKSLPRWEFARTMDRMKKCGWVSPTFSLPNTLWLLPMEDLKGCGVP